MNIAIRRTAILLQSEPIILGGRTAKKRISAQGHGQKC